MTNAYFVSYGTRCNEYQVWSYGMKVFNNAEPNKVLDFLMSKLKEGTAEPRIIVLGLPDFDARVQKAFAEIRDVEKKMGG